MGTWTLLLLVTITWLLWAVGALYGHYIAKCEGRVRPDSGVSLAPILPIFPLVFFGLAKLVDMFVAPWGSWIIGSLHALLVVAFLAAILWQLLRPKQKPPGGTR